MKKLIQMALEDHSTRIKINDIPINNIRYTDDMMIIADGSDERI